LVQDLKSSETADLGDLMIGDEVQFGPFRLDFGQHTLSRDGAPVRIGSRALDILCALALAKGNVVTKDALMALVWPNQIVEDNAIQVQVSALRKALDEEASGQSYVITVPGRGYRFIGLQPSSSASVHDSRDTPSEFDSRSIAVLPFQNNSSDPEQEYFADGMAADIIAGLSRIKWLFVITRNASLVFKGKPIDIKQVGRELGVRYLLEGGVRKLGNRVRITVQLIEAETGVHLWVERYDRLLDDIFALQDEITMSVIGAIEPNLRRAEIERVGRKRPDSLDAYDLVLRALPFVYSHIAEDAATAIPLLAKALELDARYAAAHAFLALCYHCRFSRAGLREEDRSAAVRHARAAIAAGGDDATTLGIAGFVISLDDHDCATALTLFDRALALSNSNAFPLCFSAITLSWMGKTNLAVERAQRALRLNPFDSLNHLSYNALAISYFQTGRFEEARDVARCSVQLNPRFSVPHALLAAALVRLGRDDDAKAEAQWVLTLDPTFTIRRFSVTTGLEPAVYATFAQAWQAVGLPEE
jgi:TolB-like protein/Tfp pilus assembly protein PilF